jgi:alpha-ketoglutarate-dependent 2,4-dichlorophenoxyacetate dioxygenase
VSLDVRPLHAIFAAELTGADLRAEITAELIAAVEANMRRYGVLVLRDQHITDDDHIRFSRAFGPLELPPKLGLPAGPKLKRRMRPELFDSSNLTPDGQILPADAPKRTANKGAERFHMDSSYSPLPLKWSLLLGHEIPPEQGDTEFVDCRHVHAQLPEATQRRIEHLVSIHDFFESRRRRGLSDPTPEMRRLLPPVQHKLVQVAPDGQRTLFVGGSAIAIVGMNDDDAVRLLDELYRFATQPHFVFAHRWRKGDLVIWDNRCTLHRATEFDSFTHRRDVRRTTIHASGPEIAIDTLSA